MATTKEIVARISQPIPLPRSAAPKPQDSWAALKAGDRLQLRDDRKEALSSDNLIDASGVVWVVYSVDSAGARLEPQSEEGRYIGPPPDPIVLTTRDWRDTWERVKRRKKGESGDGCKNPALSRI